MIAKHNFRPVQELRIFQEFASEREEILKHKWIESEKAGQDIGFDKALLDWVIHHRSVWRAHARSKNECADTVRV